MPPKGRVAAITQGQVTAVGRYFSERLTHSTLKPKATANAVQLLFEDCNIWLRNHGFLTLSNENQLGRQWLDFRKRLQAPRPRVNLVGDGRGTLVAAAACIGVAARANDDTNRVVGNVHHTQARSNPAPPKRARLLAAVSANGTGGNDHHGETTESEADKPATGREGVRGGGGTVAPPKFGCKPTAPIFKCNKSTLVNSGNSAAGSKISGSPLDRIVSGDTTESEEDRHDKVQARRMAATGKVGDGVLVPGARTGTASADHGESVVESEFGNDYGGDGIEDNEDTLRNRVNKRGSRARLEADHGVAGVVRA